MQTCYPGSTHGVPRVASSWHHCSSIPGWGLPFHGTTWLRGCRVLQQGSQQQDGRRPRKVEAKSNSSLLRNVILLISRWQNLVIWLYLTSREAGKYSLFFGWPGGPLNVGGFITVGKDRLVIVAGSGQQFLPFMACETYMIRPLPAIWPHLLNLILTQSGHKGLSGRPLSRPTTLLP